MTTISLDALREIYEQETGAYPILLLSLSHPELAEDACISSDSTTRIPGLTTDRDVVYGTVSQSVSYIYCPVSISWPDDFEGAAPRSTLTIGNIGQMLTEPIRSISTSPVVRMQLVISTNTDRVDMSFDDLRFESIDINTLSISGELSLDMMETEPSPPWTCTPSTTPGIFKT